MALVKLGPLASEISGKIGGTVFSHNRGGQYIRSLVIPTKVQNPYTQAVRDALSACARAWGGLTPEQRGAWKQYSISNPSVNRLGMSKTLSGHMAFNQINTRLVQQGAAMIDVPSSRGPSTPPGALSVALAAGAGTGIVTFAPTPLPAGVALWLWAAVPAGPGAQYIGNRWRLVWQSAGAAATGGDCWDDLVARFGALSAGAQVEFRGQLLDTKSGLVSAFVSTSSVVGA